MIIIKNINLKENEGWKITNEDFKKISTTMDEKELFITITGDDVEPRVIEKENVTLINNLFLDLNEKASIISRSKHLQIFDDTGMVIRYRAPEGKTIKSINKFTDTTSIRYIKLSQDKTEALLLVTYRFNYLANNRKTIISNRYDGILEFNLDDGSKELLFPTDRTFEIERQSMPVKILSTYVNNILYLNDRDSKTTVQEIMQNFTLFNRGYSIVNNEKDLHAALKQSCFNEIYFKNVKKEIIEEILKGIDCRYRAQSVNAKSVKTIRIQYRKNTK